MNLTVGLERDSGYHNRPTLEEPPEWDHYTSRATLNAHTTTNRYRTGTVNVMERTAVIYDPDLGTIAAVIDAEGTVLSTAADVLEPVNVRPHMAAIDLASRELAALYARRFPDHDAWLKRMIDDCLTEGDA